MESISRYAAFSRPNSASARGTGRGHLRRADIIQSAMCFHFPFRAFCLAFAGVTFLWLAGCQKAQINTNEAVREAVVRHLSARGDLGLGELDIQVENAQFEGDTCRAAVRISPKGQPADMGMTMNYTLEREGDSWKVKPNPAAGGHAMQPPAGSPQEPNAPGAPPATPQPSPNPGSLPPGHPPVASQPK